MTDFDYENLQKKRTAQGARHKKGGSKSRKCTMPSDYLTKAQKEALNGPVTTILLNQPMDWETYKSLSETLQKTYLTNLKNTYNPNTSMLARMFGVTPNPVTAQLHKHGLPIGPKGAKPSKERQAMWEAFCNGVVGGGNNQSAEEPETHTYDLSEEEWAKIAEAGTTYEPVAEPEDELTAALKEILDEVEADPYGDEAEALADAIIEASFQPVRACIRELNTTITGSPCTVMDNIRDLLALFNDAPVEVKIEIRPK